jgi:hypothetical protein
MDCAPRRHADLLELAPGSVPCPVQLEAERNFLVRLVGQMQHPAVKAGEQEGLGGLSRLHIITDPNAAAPDRRPQLAELRRRNEPEVGLRLPRTGDLAFRATGV